MSRKNKNRTQFENDWQFYFTQRHHFIFSGSDIKDSYKIQFPGEPDIKTTDDEGKEITVPWTIPYSKQGKTAKECFYKLDSEGKRLPCSEPQLLVEILNCKASINLQIKIWAQSRAEYTLPLIELQEYMEHFKCPEWVLKAVEAQKTKILRQWGSERKWEQHGFYYDAMKYNMGEALEEISKQEVIFVSELPNIKDTIK